MFRSDGSVDVVQAGDPPPPLLRYEWPFFDKQGDDLILDIGKEFGALGNSQLRIRLTAPDAFTLIKTVRLGVVQPGPEYRYVRTGPPTPASANAQGFPPSPRP